MIVKYCFVRYLSTKNAYFNSTNFEKVSYCCFLPIPEPLCSPRWEWAIMSSTPTLPGQSIVPFSMSNTSWSRITLSLICTDLLKDRRRHSHNYAQLPHSFNVSDWLTDGDQQTLDRAELKYTSWSIVIAGTARIFMYFVGVVNVRMRIVWCSTAKIFHSIANTGENSARNRISLSLWWRNLAQVKRRFWVSLGNSLVYCMASPATSRTVSSVMG